MSVCLSYWGWQEMTDRKINSVRGIKTRKIREGRAEVRTGTRDAHFAWSIGQQREAGIQIKITVKTQTPPTSTHELTQAPRTPSICRTSPPHRHRWHWSGVASSSWARVLSSSIIRTFRGRGQRHTLRHSVMESMREGHRHLDAIVTTAMSIVDFAEAVSPAPYGCMLGLRLIDYVIFSFYIRRVELPKVETVVAKSIAVRRSTSLHRGNTLKQNALSGDYQVVDKTIFFNILLVFFASRYELPKKEDSDSENWREI